MTDVTSSADHPEVTKIGENASDCKDGSTGAVSTVESGKPTTASSSPTRSSSSPEPNCAICLSRLENKSFTDSCFHMFCFVCLMEWSKVKAECPLCKQPFKSIIHNVRSYEDYDQYHLERPENQSPFSGHGGRFRYRTTLTQDRVFSLRVRQRYSDILQRPTTITTRQNWRRQRQIATSEFRKRVYTNGMRVVRDNGGRYREISPMFFTSNPAATHRLVPWLNRELNALLHNHEEHVQFVLDLILGLIKRYPVHSEEFYQHVYPFVGRYTRHFMHEFENYARSPYCMTAYDQKAVYEQQPESVSDSDSVTSDNGNDSDVMIVSPDESSDLHSRSDFFSSGQQCEPPIERRGALLNEITPVSVTLRELLEDDNLVTGQSGWESPIPGPSWSFYPESNCSSATTALDLFGHQPYQSAQREQQSIQPSHEVKIEGIHRNSQGVDSGTDSDSDSNSVSSAGSDIIFVGYDKPWQERTPIVLSSESEGECVVQRSKKSNREKDSSGQRHRYSCHREENSSSRRRRSKERDDHRNKKTSSSPKSCFTGQRRSRSSSRSHSYTRHGSHTSHSASSYHNRKKRHHNSPSVTYEDILGYGRKHHLSSEETSISSRGSRNSESRKRYKSKDHKSHSYNPSSSRSRSRSPYRRGVRHRSKESRTRYLSSRSPSVEYIGYRSGKRRSKHKKHKKHKKHSSTRHEGEKCTKHNKKEKAETPDKRKREQHSAEADPLTKSTNIRVKQGQAPKSVIIEVPLKIETPEKDLLEDGEISDYSENSLGMQPKVFKKHPSGHKKSRKPEDSPVSDNGGSECGVEGSNKTETNLERNRADFLHCVTSSDFVNSLGKSSLVSPSIGTGGPAVCEQVSSSSISNSDLSWSTPSVSFQQQDVYPHPSMFPVPTTETVVVESSDSNDSVTVDLSLCLQSSDQQMATETVVTTSTNTSSDHSLHQLYCDLFGQNLVDRIPQILPDSHQGSTDMENGIQVDSDSDAEIDVTTRKTTENMHTQQIVTHSTFQELDEESNHNAHSETSCRSLYRRKVQDSPIHVQSVNIDSSLPQITEGNKLSTCEPEASGQASHLSHPTQCDSSILFSNEQKVPTSKISENRYDESKCTPMNNGVSVNAFDSGEESNETAHKSDLDIVNTNIFRTDGKDSDRTFEDQTESHNQFSTDMHSENNHLNLLDKRNIFADQILSEVKSSSDCMRSPELESNGEDTPGIPASSTPLQDSVLTDLPSHVTEYSNREEHQTLDLGNEIQEEKIMATHTLVSGNEDG